MKKFVVKYAATCTCGNPAAVGYDDGSDNKTRGVLHLKPECAWFKDVSKTEDFDALISALQREPSTEKLDAATGVGALICITWEPQKH